jgi:hypothetical protein
MLDTGLWVTEVMGQGRQAVARAAGAPANGKGKAGVDD